MRAIKHLTLAALLASAPLAGFAQESVDGEPDVTIRQEEIGRASCRERV